MRLNDTQNRKEYLLIFQKSLGLVKTVVVSLPVPQVLKSVAVVEGNDKWKGLKG